LESDSVLNGLEQVSPSVVSPSASAFVAGVVVAVAFAVPDGHARVVASVRAAKIAPEEKRGLGLTNYLREHDLLHTSRGGPRRCLRLKQSFSRSSSSLRGHIVD
jgi:hypothetical protein